MTPRIIASRRYAKKYPENTMIAFRKALEHGADGIECDLRFTRDGEVVIHHVAELGVTENGEGYIYNQDSSYLGSLDCGTWFSPDFAGERMPFLKEVFAAFGDSTFYEIELKDYEKEFVDEVVRIARGSGLLSRIEFTSFHYQHLSYLKRNEPAATVGLIIQDIPAWMTLRQAHELAKLALIEGIVDVVHFPVDLCNHKLVDDIHSKGALFHAGVCNSREQLQKAVQIGADRLSTYDVELAVSSR